MKAFRHLILFTASLGSFALLAAPPGPLTYGVQVSLGTPVGGDLPKTTGGMGMGFGLHATWGVHPLLELRPRLDAVWYSGGSQHATPEGWTHDLHTWVSNLSVGVDALTPIAYSPISVGVSLQSIRWRVAATNDLAPATGGQVSHSGTASWNQVGVGPVATWRVNPRVELEARAIFSRYGQENEAANTVSIGLLWHF